MKEQKQVQKISPKQLQLLLKSGVINQAKYESLINDLEKKNLLSGTRGNHSELMKQFNSEFKSFSDKFFAKYNKGSDVFNDLKDIKRQVSLAYKKVK